MAARFQITEFHSDPFDPVPRAGGERLEEEGSSGGSLERRPSGVRGRRVEASETVAFPDGVSVTRRVTLPEEELLEDVLSFRGRTRSEPPNFWLAVQYGRELRRMSDEFVSSFSEDKGLRISKSAGAIVSTMYQKLVWYLPKKGQTEPQQTDSP